MVVLSNIIDRNYPLQHSKNMFYHLQLIIHHVQVIWHECPSRLNLILNTLIQIKKEQHLKYRLHPINCTIKLTPLNDTLYLKYVKLHTTTKLRPTGKNICVFWLTKKISGCQVCQVTRTASIYQKSTGIFYRDWVFWIS